MTEGELFAAYRDLQPLTVPTPSGTRGAVVHRIGPPVPDIHNERGRWWTKFGDKTLSGGGLASDDGAVYTPSPEAQP